MDGDIHFETEEVDHQHNSNKENNSENETTQDQVTVTDNSCAKQKEERKFRKRAKKAEVWNHFHEQEGWIICNYNKEHKLASSSGTSTLMYHMNHLHPNELKKGPPDQAAVDRMFASGRAKHLQPNRQKVLDHAVRDFITWDGVPPNVVEGPGFKNMLSEFESRYQLPHQTTFTRSLIPEQYEQLHRVVKEDLKQAQFYCLTTDMWVDIYRRLYYVGLTVHFIDANWKQCSFVLVAKQFSERHTAMNIAAELRRLSTEWGIPLDKSAWVPDNGANILTALNLMEVFHFTCFGHNINLCLMADGIEKVKSFDGLIKKSKKGIQHFKYRKCDVEKKQKDILAREKKAWAIRSEQRALLGEEGNDDDEPERDTSGIFVQDHDYYELVDDQVNLSKTGM